MSAEWKVYVGLEIHIHLLTRSKMFCSCPAHFGDEPNSNVCPVCMGMPGVLPRLNAQAVELGYRVALALGCKISERSLFDRKNYFYPDMPKNYQISQFHHPVGRDGAFEIPLSGGGTKVIKIRECHLEEDAGKMIHSGDLSLIDYNRAGVPLLEIVTEPDDLASGQDAEDYIRAFQRLVRWLEVCDGNMEEGSLRCDANVSINRPGAGLGSKVEVKNLNSSRFVRLALDHEIGRQAEVLEAGGSIPQETRLWNENRDRTEVMRTKESSHDYRYFPEPDLPPFTPDAAFLSAVGASIPELPLACARRLQAQYALTPEQAELIHDRKADAAWFEAAVRAALADPSAALGSPALAGAIIAQWMTGDLRKELNRAGFNNFAEGPMTPGRMAELAILLTSGKINGKIAKGVLAEVFASDKAPRDIVREKGLERISDPEAIGRLVAEVLAAQSGVAAAVKAGDAKQKEFLVGRVLAASGGRAEPSVVRQSLDAALERT